jgi:hypothetical protein
LAGEDLLEALPHVHSSRGRAAVRTSWGNDDLDARAHVDARTISLLDLIFNDRCRRGVRYARFGHRPLLRPQISLDQPYAPDEGGIDVSGVPRC